jgi:hypothetical protein
MNNLKSLSKNELIKVDGGFDYENVSWGYPGRSLVEFIWSTLEGAYQHGYDDKIQNIEPCVDYSLI